MVTRTCEEKRRLGMEIDFRRRTLSYQVDPPQPISADNQLPTEMRLGGGVPQRARAGSGSTRAFVRLRHRSSHDVMTTRAPSVPFWESLPAAGCGRRPGQSPTLLP